MRPSARVLCLRSICVASVAAMALTACGSGESASGSGGDSGKKLKMGIAVANISLNFANSMVDGAKQAAQHEGNVDFQAVGPPNTDGPAEEQLFQSLTSTATDGIVLENLDPPIFTRPAAQAIDKGITVVALDTAPTDGSKIKFYVGNDNYKLGQQLADETLKNLPANPSGEVLVGVPNPGTPVLDNRAKGIIDELKSKAPGISIIGPFQTYSDPAQNYNAWLSQVHAHPKALAFLGSGTPTATTSPRSRPRRTGSTWRPASTWTTRRSPTSRTDRCSAPSTRSTSSRATS